MPVPLGAFQGIVGKDEWGVPLPGQGRQFGNPVELLRGGFDEGVKRFAGQPLEGEAGRVRDALIYGQLEAEDETGRVSIGRDGSLRLTPRGQMWNLQAGPGSIKIGFDARQEAQESRDPSGILEAQGPEDPLSRSSGAKQELEKMLASYQGANPEWYRP